MCNRSYRLVQWTGISKTRCWRILGVHNHC
uniref:BLTX738 n=1 Tax=Nephila pilipes TaxID=299642 RepID=A0A076L350_NEPPI|nr:BLTX738 [Nephila pilipes]